MPASWPAEFEKVVLRLRGNPAELSACRRGLGHEPFSQPAAQMFMLVPEAAGCDERDHIVAAVHHALTLYAFHQHGKSGLMHRSGPRYGYGPTVRRLVDLATVHRGQARQIEQSFFRCMGVGIGLTSLAGHVRRTIHWMREFDVELDYRQFVIDLAAFADPAAECDPRRGWSRAYYERDDLLDY